MYQVLSVIRYQSRRAAYLARQRAQTLASWILERRDHFWLLALLLVAAVYLTNQFILKDLFPANLNVLVLQPLLWLLVALTSFLMLRGFPGRHRPDRSLIALGAVFGLFQVAAWLLAGFVFGFGRSPHGTEFSVLLGNAFFASSSVLGMELSRAGVVTCLKRRSPVLAIALSALVLAAVSIPIGQYRSIVGVGSALRIGGKLILPTLAQSLLASIMVLAGGPVPALVYQGLLAAFEWLSPLQPDLQMIVGAFVGTMPAALSLLAMEDYLGQDAEPDPNPKAKDEISTSWVIASVVSITILFFNIGAFGYRPTLIIGPSMEPAIHTGDLVITQPVEAESLEEGDVIRFRTESGRSVVHRIIEIQFVGSSLRFTTQGDNNNIEDEPIFPEQIEGKMVMLLPDLGWPAVFLRDLITWLT